MLGRWAPEEVAVGEAGRNKIVVLGEHAVVGRRLADTAARVRTPRDIDGPAGELAGNSHLVASTDGKVRVQGTVTGFRRVFSAEINGVAAASDRADVLAFLLGSVMDERRLAVHLLVPSLLHPLTNEPVWRGVSFLPTDRFLLLDENGQAQQVRWWTPPEPELPLAEGGRKLRAALTAAVDVRTGGHELVSCDLSGLDSTSVCSLAARRSKVVACTAASPDPLDDDVLWATRTAAALDSVEHHVIAQDEMPLIYHGLLDMDELLDEPCGSIADYARWLTIARRGAARGSRLHLTGFGGDELLASSTSHLRTVVRTRPAVALRQLNALAAKHRWSRRQMLRQLADSRPYHSWLMGTADRLTTPAPEGGPVLGWGPAPSLPPWVTAEAVDSVRELIRAAAPTSEPLAERQGQHLEIEGIQYAARPVRQIGRLAARIGITLAAPYYDDRVLEAGLAVRPEEKDTPWRYKPLILEAMRGIVPAESLTRQTKSGGICDLNVALRSNRADLLALWDDSRLGRLGLIDAAELRRLCTRPLDPHDPHDLHGGLYQTVACEVWLRAWERATTHPKAGAKP
ncbi:asparagine synthase-related protein [Streptomyces spiramyceticus]|uniref:asparagine synthase-related protein n=1 Tax=Streptomyces spiramyceticus TaxID=299717 RepID=UPI00237B2D59|nr:asparagine synthase-related protein [Streptomyces spiramyceticus]